MAWSDVGRQNSACRQCYASSGIPVSPLIVIPIHLHSDSQQGGRQSYKGLPQSQTFCSLQVQSLGTSEESASFCWQQVDAPFVKEWYAMFACPPPPPPPITHSHPNSWKLQMPNGPSFSQLSVSTTNSKCQFTTSVLLGRVPYKETWSVGALMHVARRVETHFSSKSNIVFRGRRNQEEKKSCKSNPLTTGAQNVVRRHH